MAKGILDKIEEIHIEQVGSKRLVRLHITFCWHENGDIRRKIISAEGGHMGVVKEVFGHAIDCLQEEFDSDGDKGSGS